jgi:predicted metal-dependent phosphoesterase TrpH
MVEIGNADLHCHSCQSDGVLSPQELAKRAFARGVDLWALTDHDDVSGVAPARLTAQALGLRFVAGVEISVTWSNRTVHVVGLGIDENNTTIQQGLARLRDERGQRAQLIGHKLAALGISGAYDGAIQYVANPALVSRTHFARHLYESGHAKSMQQVFDRYLGENAVAYVPTKWASLDEAVHWILVAGGIAVIAHPARYKFSDIEFDTLFNRFREMGGQAIEVHTGSHKPHENIQYAEVARQYGFWASCGSDFHSPHESRYDLGSVPRLPADLVPVWHSLAWS